MLAVYRLSVITNWSEAAFPRQYPQWRPPAQWSKTLGFSHTDKFSLFSLGQVQLSNKNCLSYLAHLSASDRGCQEVCGAGRQHWTGRPDTQQVTSHLLTPIYSCFSSLLDSFTAPPIMAGAGESTARIFLDGRHTKVRKFILVG